MSESFKEKSDTEKDAKKTENLFSEKFIEYLRNKKTSVGNTLESSYNLSHDPNTPWLEKEAENSVTQSSDETSASDSSKKLNRKLRRKIKERPTYKSLDYSRFRNKSTQCSLLKETEEMVPPEEIKPLLVDLTILLQEFKKHSSEFDNLHNLTSKITVLMTEFVRRPLKKVEEVQKSEHSKNLQKTAEDMTILLSEYKNKQIKVLESDDGTLEFKQLQKELTLKEMEVAELNKKLSEDRFKDDPKTKDINAKVIDSIMKNKKLKDEIKFNQKCVKKYKKILLEKEWTKHKLENELTHLKRKVSKVDISDNENFNKHFLEKGDRHGVDKNMPKKLTLQKEKVKKGKDKPKSIK